MPLTPLPFANFLRGLVANAGRLSQPRGSIQRVSNLCYKKRGSLTTIDGTLIQSQNGSPPSGESIAAIAGNPVSGGDPWLTLLAKSGQTELYSVNGSIWTLLGSVPAGSMTPPPAMTPFNGKVIVTVIDYAKPQIWDGTTLAALTNNWTASGYAPSWTASTAEAVGNVIHASSAIWKCTQAGTTGSSAPTWPSSGSVTDGSVVWTRMGSTTAGTPGGAFASVAAGCLFLWGTASAYSDYDGPDSFRQSDVLDPNSWNPVNQVFVGGKDGQRAQGLAVLTIGAVGISASPRQVLFKEFSTFEFLGVFPNATLTQAKTTLGCIAPRTIQAVSELAGVVRLTHRGFALYRGVEAGSDEIISEALEPYLFGGASDITPVYMPTQDIESSAFPYLQGAVSALSINPPLYLCALPLQNGSITRVFILDLRLMKATNKPVWTVADLPWPITALNTVESGPYFNGAEEARSLVLLAPAPNNISDGTLRRWFAGDSDWDGSAIDWSFKTPQIFDPKRPQGVFLTRKANIGGTGTGKVRGISFDYNRVSDGAEKTKTLALPSAGLAIPFSKSVDQQHRGGALTISGNGPVTIEAVDVETNPRGERPYAPA